MRERSARKAETVSDADIEQMLADAAVVRDRLIDLIVLIGAGHCEHLTDPNHYARRCMSLSRVFSDATSHFLCRGELQDSHPREPIKIGQPGKSG